MTGGPEECQAGGNAPVVRNEANATSFQQKWDAFDAALDSGSPASVTFNESEVSSRAWREVIADARGGDDVFDGPSVCLHDGYGEASVHLDLPGFLDIKMKIRGTVDLTDELAIHVDKVEIGNVPGFIADRLETEIFWQNDADVDPTHSYQVTYREGEVQVDGTP